MGIYFEEEREKSRWESSQAILHRESANRQNKTEPDIKNTYGTLRYLKKNTKKDKKDRNNTDGFAVEAFEAPGTPVHTEKEKHLNRQTMKKIRQNDKQALFASETPLRDQALFFSMPGRKKSADLLQYMKELLRRQGHRTLEDAFGFLDQESERQELEHLRSTRKNFLSPESVQTDRQLCPDETQGAVSKRIDALDSRLHRKEAVERQFCSDLQLMLDQSARKEFPDSRTNRSGQEQEEARKDKKQGRHDDSIRQRRHSGSGVSDSGISGSGISDSGIPGAGISDAGIDSSFPEDEADAPPEI